MIVANGPLDGLPVESDAEILAMADCPAAIASSLAAPRI